MRTYSNGSSIHICTTYTPTNIIQTYLCSISVQVQFNFRMPDHPKQYFLEDMCLCPRSWQQEQLKEEPKKYRIFFSFFCVCYLDSSPNQSYHHNIVVILSQVRDKNNNSKLFSLMLLIHSVTFDNFFLMGRLEDMGGIGTRDKAQRN